MSIPIVDLYRVKVLSLTAPSLYGTSMEDIRFPLPFYSACSLAVASPQKTARSAFRQERPCVCACVCGSLAVDAKRCEPREEGAQKKMHGKEQSKIKRGKNEARSADPRCGTLGEEGLRLRADAGGTDARRCAKRQQKRQKKGGRTT